MAVVPRDKLEIELRALVAVCDFNVITVKDIRRQVRPDYLDLLNGHSNVCRCIIRISTLVVSSIATAHSSWKKSSDSISSRRKTN